ncbi:MAG: MBL fold metallo-hydrolase [Planctomycetes bacterium]|nr:MBL fold metallo-hydrolase [Planctomycetota bacterium]
MGLSADIIDNLTGFSKAMYSTWFYYRPARILLDSGEGVSTSMDNYSFGVEQVFLSHGHYDHIGGLPGLVHARNSARGDKEKGMKVIYPEGDALVRALRAYIERMSPHLSYEIQWHECSEEKEIPLRVGGKDAFIRSFRTQHTRSARTLGYLLVEKRTRLQPRFAALGQEEIRQKVLTSGRDEVMETYEKILLAYGGDSLALSPARVARAEVLVHDATFLSEKDREEPTHATSEEAIRVAHDAQVGLLLLHHVSSRYPLDRILQTVAVQARTLAPGLPVLLAIGRSILPVEKRETAPARQPPP